MNALLVLRLLAQTGELPPNAPPEQGVTLKSAAIDIGGHLLTVGAMGAASTGLVLSTQRTSAGLAVSEFALSNLFTFPLGGVLLATNPITVLSSEFNEEPWQRGVLLTIGLLIDVGTPALAALGAWTTERLPFTEGRGEYLSSFLGAVIGTVTALVVDAIFSRLIDHPEETLFLANWRVGLATGLISLGATLGLRLSAPPLR